MAQCFCSAKPRTRRRLRLFIAKFSEIILATSGSAEAIAAALKAHGQAMLIGQPSAGRAVEYSDFPLSSGKILRIAVAEVIGPNGQSLFPGGVKPDLPVELLPVQKHQIFALS